MAKQNVNVKVAKLDVVKWTLIGLLLLAGFAANYYFIKEPLPLRIVGWLILVLILMGIAYTTNAGSLVWRFFQDARNEMRKVVWPTRQETFQTTLIVIAMTIVLALFLWGVDMFFMWAVTRLTS